MNKKSGSEGGRGQKERLKEGGEVLQIRWLPPTHKNTHVHHPPNLFMYFCRRGSPQLYKTPKKTTNTPTHCSKTYYKHNVWNILINRRDCSFAQGHPLTHCLINRSLETHTSSHSEKPSELQLCQQRNPLQTASLHLSFSLKWCYFPFSAFPLCML